MWSQERKTSIHTHTLPKASESRPAARRSATSFLRSLSTACFFFPIASIRDFMRFTALRLRMRVPHKLANIDHPTATTPKEHGKKRKRERFLANTYHFPENFPPTKQSNISLSFLMLVAHDVRSGEKEGESGTRRRNVRWWWCGCRQKSAERKETGGVRNGTTAYSRGTAQSRRADCLLLPPRLPFYSKATN